MSARRLPWPGPGGQACYLPSDGYSSPAALWRLADEMESVQLMGEFESGWRNAGAARLREIAKVLNCPVVALERKREEQPATKEPKEKRATGPAANA